MNTGAVGMAPPQSYTGLGGAQPGYSAASLGAPAWDGQYWDQAKLDAARAAQQPGTDGRRVANDASWMSALNPLSGLSEKSPAIAEHMGFWGNTGTDGEQSMGGGQAAIYQDKLGRSYREIPGAEGDANKYLQYFQNDGGGFESAGSDSSRDRVQPIYKLGADGTATPHSANSSYQMGDWNSSGQQLAMWAAIMATAGTAGAYLGGGAAGAEAGAAGAGAGAAAQSSATQAALYGNAGYGASTAGEAGFAGLGGTTAGGSAGLTAAEVASLEAGGGFAAAGGTGWGSTLKDLYKAGTAVNDASKGGGSNGGGGGQSPFGMVMMSPGDRYRQQLMAQAMRDRADQQSQQAMPGWIPGG